MISPRLLAAPGFVINTVLLIATMVSSINTESGYPFDGKIWTCNPSDLNQNTYVRQTYGVCLTERIKLIYLKASI